MGRHKKMIEGEDDLQNFQKKDIQDIEQSKPETDFLELFKDSTEPDETAKALIADSMELLKYRYAHKILVEALEYICTQTASNPVFKSKKRAGEALQKAAQIIGNK